MHHAIVKVVEYHVLWRFKLDLQDLLLFAAVDSKDSVGGDRLHRLAVLVILRVNRILLGGRLRGQHAVAEGKTSDTLSVFRVVRNVLRDDVAGARKRFFGIGNTLLRIYVCFSLFFNRR